MLTTKITRHNIFKLMSLNWNICYVFKVIHINIYELLQERQGYLVEMCVDSCLNRREVHPWKTANMWH